MLVVPSSNTVVMMMLIINSCWCQQLASDVSDEKLPLAGISK